MDLFPTFNMAVQMSLHHKAMLIDIPLDVVGVIWS
jgi:hypothetical protein